MFLKYKGTFLFCFVFLNSGSYVQKGTFNESTTWHIYWMLTETDLTLSSVSWHSTSIHAYKNKKMAESSIPRVLLLFCCCTCPGILAVLGHWTSAFQEGHKREAGKMK